MEAGCSRGLSAGISMRIDMGWRRANINHTAWGFIIVKVVTDFDPFL